MYETIVVESLTKRFRDIVAIDNVSFSVAKGEIFGIVGPDGGGKTTLIKLLSGILKPDKGKIQILGKDLEMEYEQLKFSIGYLSQNFSHYTDLTVEENLEFFAEIHKVENYQERLEFLLEFARLKNFRKTLIGDLSGGMKQKLALISSLIYDPVVLFLDEPNTGVDPISRREFWLLLNKLVENGKTIVFSTPYLDEAERFHKVLMLDKGKMLGCDTPENFISGFDYHVVEIICSDLLMVEEILMNQFEVQTFGDRLNVLFPKEKLDFINWIRKTLQSNNIEIYQISNVRPSLENVFFNLLKKH